MLAPVTTVNVGTLAGLGPAGEHAGRERAVGAAARHRKPWTARLRQHLLEVGCGVAPDAHAIEAWNDGRGLVFRREFGSRRQTL